MADYNYDPTNTSAGFGKQYDFVKQQTFVQKVFNWMGMGLALTGFVAYFVSSNEMILRVIYSNMIILLVLGIGTFALVWNISANAHKMSHEAAVGNFLIYAALNGILLSSIFIIYTAASIASTFFICAATFGATAFYGATTKKDLSGMGSIAFMALIGIIIASVVNMFLHSEGLASMLNYLGVLVFVGLTAHDMQKIKQIGQSNSYHPNMAINAALTLYLDFINLFLFLLRILGDRRK